MISKTLVKDRETGVAYIDVGNPIDVRMPDVPDTNSEKEYVHALTVAIRYKMNTAVYHIMKRHISLLKRSRHPDMWEFQ